MVAWLPVIAVASLLASLGGTAMTAQAANAAIRRQKQLAAAARRQGEQALAASGADTLSVLRQALAQAPQAYDYGAEDAAARRRHTVRDPLAPEVRVEAARYGNAGTAVGAQRALEELLRREAATRLALGRGGSAIAADQASRARLVNALMAAAQQPQTGYSLFGDLLHGLGQFGQLYAFSGGLGGGGGTAK